ncbi:hypothetical protein [Actinomadura flavalba]|uniref:hypothetical protein n=1 Tax=Actinomadura flavalba TaxID=1120938 RepID=UPI00035C7689|nr:hypothetical protein [Actinomadura flavalba]
MRVPPPSWLPFAAAAGALALAPGRPVAPALGYALLLLALTLTRANLAVPALAGTGAFAATLIGGPLTLLTAALAAACAAATLTTATRVLGLPHARERHAPPHSDPPDTRADAASPRTDALGPLRARGRQAVPHGGAPAAISVGGARAFGPSLSRRRHVPPHGDGEDTRAGVVAPGGAAWGSLVGGVFAVAFAGLCVVVGAPGGVPGVGTVVAGAVVVAVAAWGVGRTRAGAAGRLLAAVRDDPRASAALGVDGARVALLLAVAAAALAGAAGPLLAAPGASLADGLAIVLLASLPGVATVPGALAAGAGLAAAQAFVPGAHGVTLLLVAGAAAGAVRLAPRLGVRPVVVAHARR